MCIGRFSALCRLVGKVTLAEGRLLVNRTDGRVYCESAGRRRTKLNQILFPFFQKGVVNVSYQR